MGQSGLALGTAWGVEIWNSGENWEQVLVPPRASYVLSGALWLGYCQCQQWRL